MIKIDKALIEDVLDEDLEKIYHINKTIKENKKQWMESDIYSYRLALSELDYYLECYGEDVICAIFNDTLFHSYLKEEIKDCDFIIENEESFEDGKYYSENQPAYLGARDLLYL